MILMRNVLQHCIVSIDHGAGSVEVCVCVWLSDEA